MLENSGAHFNPRHPSNSPDTPTPSKKLKNFSLKERSLAANDEKFEALLGSERKVERQIQINNPPTNIQELLEGTGPKGKITGDIYSPISLPDGTETNYFEIHLARYLREHGIGRDASGALTSKEGKKLDSRTIKLVDASLQRDLTRKGEDASISTIIPRFYSNLEKAGLIRKTDFNVVTTETNFSYINKKITSVQVQLPSMFGKVGGIYYVGRETFSGTKTQIDRESAEVRILDYKTAGIFQKGGVGDSVHLLYTFPLKSEEWFAEQEGKTSTSKFVSGKENPLSEYTESIPAEDIYQMRFDLLRLGTSVNAISWNDQVKLYGYLARGGGNSSKLKEFISTFKEDGLLSFLAYENNPLVGKKIQELSTKEPELARKVFSKVSGILKKTDEIDSFLAESLGQSGDTASYRESIRRSLLKKSADTLITFSDAAGKEDVATLLESLEQVRAEAVLFSSSFKILKESGLNISLESIKNCVLEDARGGTIPPETAKEMIRIYKENQSANKLVQKTLVDEFTKRLSDPRATFYILKYEDQIQSFVAFSDDTADDSLKMSAFNVNPIAKGNRIGDAMLEQVVNAQANENILTADCDSKLPISSKYIETGWVGTSYFNDQGDMILDIKRDDIQNKNYWGKSQSKESIITQRTHPENVRVEVAQKQAELPFNLCNKGYVLTRMFDSGLHYAVFELPENKEEE